MSTKKLAISSLGFALIFIFTMLKISVAIVGYIHIGDAAILIVSSLLPPGLSAVVAGLSSALVDLVSGYGNYAIATFLIKALLAFVASRLLKKEDVSQVKLFVVMWILVVLGYSLWDLIQLGSPYYALLSVVTNTVQIVVSFLLFRIIYEKLGPSIRKKRI